MGAIVIHAEHVLAIVDASFQSLGRTWCLELLVLGLKLKVVGAHRDAKYITKEQLYMKDIHNRDSLIQERPADSYIYSQLLMYRTDRAHVNQA